MCIRVSILLLVDGVGAFREQYENGPTSRHAWFTAFAQIAADGRAVGVHVVVAGDRPNSVPASINSTVQRRIVLRMANDDEYQTLGVARDVLGPTSPAGRGILDGDEIQIAVLGENGNVAVQARELQRLSASVSRAGIVPPMPIRRLPDRVDLAELSSVSPDGIVLGVDDLTLGPALVEPSGAFLIAGPPRSGRSTAAATIAASIARARPAWSRTLVSLRRSSVRGEWTTRIESAEDLTRALPELRRLVQESQHCHLLVLESVGELDDHALGSELAGLVRDAVRNEHFVIGEAEASAWARVYDLGKIFRSAKRGVVLGAAGDDVYSLLDARVPVERSADVPVGRGFYGARGAVSRVQVAVSTGG